MLTDEQLASMRKLDPDGWPVGHPFLLHRKKILTHIDAQDARIAELTEQRDHSRSWTRWWRRSFLRGYPLGPCPAQETASDGWQVGQEVLP